MTRLPFRYSQADGLYRADILPDHGPFLRGWRWPDDKSCLLDSELELTPLVEKFAIRDLEEIAIFLGLIWQLTEGYARLVLPCGEGTIAASGLGRQGEAVRWEYNLDVEGRSGTVSEGGFFHSQGFVSLSTSPSQMFRVGQFAELVALQRVLHGCDFSWELNVFAVRPGRYADVATTLAGNDRPVLREVLQGDELFIDFHVISEWGFDGALFVRSCVPLYDRLQPLIARFERAILEYEAKANSPLDLRTVFAAMHAFANPGAERGEQ